MSDKYIKPADVAAEQPSPDAGAAVVYSKPLDVQQRLDAHAFKAQMDTGASVADIQEAHIADLAAKDNTIMEMTEKHQKEMGEKDVQLQLKDAVIAELNAQLQAQKAADSGQSEQSQATAAESKPPKKAKGEPE